MRARFPEVEEIVVAMLRITQVQTETSQRWTLSGQLTWPWVAELRGLLGNATGQTANAQTVVLILSGRHVY